MALLPSATVQRSVLQDTYITVATSNIHYLTGTTILDYPRVPVQDFYNTPIVRSSTKVPKAFCFILIPISCLLKPSLMSQGLVIDDTCSLFYPFIFFIDPYMRHLESKSWGSNNTICVHKASSRITRVIDWSSGVRTRRWNITDIVQSI